MTELKIHRQDDVNSDDVFLQDILEGLIHSPQKTLPCKYFYDEKGSVLFDQICNTPEYYHTRTELQILDECLPKVADLVGPNADILEFGSGAGIKIEKLIDALDTPRSYTPIDISEEILLSSAKTLKQRYPTLDVNPVVADYLSHIDLPKQFFVPSEHKKLVFFPGSTISNFEPQDALHFMKHNRQLLNPGDGMLVGVDLIKPVQTLIAAYNDIQGITAAFNMNLLERIKNTYNTSIDLNNFAHHAIYNTELHRIEMHLASLREQTFHIEGHQFSMKAKESIHTENSYKYSVESFRMIARNTGFDCTDCFTDDSGLFSVHYLTAV